MRNFVVAVALAAGSLGLAGTADAQSTSSYSAGGPAVPAPVPAGRGYAISYDPYVYNPYAYNPYDYNPYVSNAYSGRRYRVWSRRW